MILKKIQVFGEEKYLLFGKRTNFRTFWDFYFFSGILRQFWYNLVMKNFKLRNRSLCPDNYQVIVNKTHHFESMIFLPFYKYGRKIIISLPVLESWSCRIYKSVNYTYTSRMLTWFFCKTVLIFPSISASLVLYLKMFSGDHCCCFCSNLKGHTEFLGENSK